MSHESRRRKIAYATPEAILGLTNQRIEAGDGRSCYVPIVRGLPADAQVVAVNFDPSRHAFALAIESEAFEPVHPGQVLPEIEIWCDVAYLPPYRHVSDD